MFAGYLRFWLIFPKISQKLQNGRATSDLVKKYKTKYFCCRFPVLASVIAILGTILVSGFRFN